jgi:branched-chain amino acid transport system ATP-binding protein
VAAEPRRAPTPPPATTGTGPLLQVTDVRKSFGGVKALQGATFSVGHGEMVGLLGPNGAGKSTLFNCIAGVERVDSGRVVLAGQDITRLGAHQRARLGIARTYQTIRLFPNLSALENVAVGTLRRSGSTVAEERAAEMLGAVGLQADPSQTASSLSLVDQRRVELARAMVTDAGLVMLDEVMTGLNDSEVEDMRRVVRELNTTHSTTFVIVEHVMGHILPLISRAVIMVQGAVLAEGRPDEVLERADVLEAYFGQKVEGSVAHDV